VAEECERLAYSLVKLGRPIDVTDAIVAQPLLASVYATEAAPTL
jgi:hypothetical protein